MCLIILALHPDPLHRLVLVANRDEGYARPTAPAREWEDAPGVLAGRDLQGGGTWLGVTRATGRFAALTNFHEKSPPDPAAPTRGTLVADYLSGSEPPEAYLRRVAGQGNRFNGFNLLAGDTRDCFWYSNRGPAEPRRLEPGIYGLSNHLLDTPWSKVTIARRRVAAVIAAGPPLSAADLLEALNDRDIPPPGPADPPLSAEERPFSAPFILTPDYGTRSTSALVIFRNGGGWLAERTYDGGSGSAVSPEIRHQLRSGAD